MYDMHLTGKTELLITKIKALKVGIEILKLVAGSLIAEFTTKSAFILAIAINKKVTKIKTSFLAWQVIST